MAFSSARRGVIFGLMGGTMGPSAGHAVVSPPAAAPKVLPPGAPPNPGNTKNCKDFATYEEAKAWYDKYKPFYGDIAKLDGDGDGKPCE
eukprot:CAMPEP_0197640174 /NCGR_PEP_ID=MMETSP1338-20131121/14554_1 /TAXON_ID=43686 ORGANISM="Pelagodinium beii, Strain RCC1491" /NCGR_SAMPLE_ID=MMETSP1338 /ASSEMBLY_ACC=CAM_ASM_000754 /LENGTH=88 /DNA_ID=CAMNT_0043212995 /DNA_START=61 /DNA_END=324 /DNA_ORIENTATION=+